MRVSLILSYGKRNNSWLVWVFLFTRILLDAAVMPVSGDATTSKNGTVIETMKLFTYYWLSRRRQVSGN